MRFGSVCSGIEAASVAWKPLGWTPAFFAEIDPAPSAVLGHHYPEVLNLGDFTTIGPRSDVDLLCGGTPCQSFSVAGRRLGLDDPRGNLAIEFLRLARRLGPRWLVWENVPGVLSSSGGRDFGAFLGLLGELGYGWAYRVLDAQYVRVDGLGRAVPQRRRRVFVVGHLGGLWQRAAAVLFEPACLSGNPPPSREPGQGVAGTLAAGAHPGGLNGRDVESGNVVVADSLEASMGRRCGQPNCGSRDGQLIVASPVAPGLTSNYFGDHESREGLLVAYQCHGNNVGPMGTFRSGNGSETGGVPFIACYGGHFDGPSEVATTLNAHGGGRLDMDSETFVATFAWQAGGAQTTLGFDPESGTCQTLGRDQLPAAAILEKTGRAVRRLTPVECERLQGFPGNYTLVPYKGRMMADGPRYKMIGNSWAVNAARWVGTRIVMMEELINKGAA